MDTEILQKLCDIELLLYNPTEEFDSILEYCEWLETICSWLSFHVSVWVPAILFGVVFWWFFHQFMTRYY